MKNKYIQLIIFMVAILGLFSLINRKNNSIGDELNINSVNAIEFSELAKNKEAFLLDVHIPEQTHIPGTDAFVPFDELGKNLDKLPENKDTKILVYCRSGSMSRQAAYDLQQMGYTNVVELAGGINAYKEANVSVGISPDARDLGTVVYGDVAKTEFTLTNFTPAELNITKVSTSCGCTSASVDKETLEPYESTVIKVSFDPAVHKDDTDLGELTRTIYIETDNPNFSQLEVSISANVLKK